MSRVARIVVPGFPHHVTQRGNRQVDVFESDDDRHAYLGFLKKYAGRHGLDIWAYCLMSNHVHLVLVPQREESLGRALRDAHTIYTMRFNTRTGLNGHLWQGRFYSCTLDEAHLWAAVRYVERNPVRTGIVKRAEDYPWSSAPDHCGLRHQGLLSADFPPPGVVEDWADWLRVEDDAEAVDRIRRQTRTGRPCGTASFMVRLESLLGRVVRPGKRGRKPKDKKKSGDGKRKK